MSRHELHDLLARLADERGQLDMVSEEKRQRLDEIVESLEQQALYPDAFDQYSVIGAQINELLVDQDDSHPTLTAVLNSIAQVLRNFRA